MISIKVQTHICLNVSDEIQLYFVLEKYFGLKVCKIFLPTLNFWFIDFLDQYLVNEN